MAVPVETGRYRVGDEPAPGYRLIEFLGKGEFGHVWKAASPGGIEVALKIIDLSRTGGSKELRAVRLIKLKRIRHPNLCPVIAFWLKDARGNILHDADQEVKDSAVGDAEGGGGATQPLADAANRDLEPDGPVPSRLLSETLDVSDQETERTRPTAPPTTAPPTPADMVPEDVRAVELLIAMGLGDGTLTDRLRGCQAEGHEGIPVDELLDYFEAAANAIDCLNQKHGIQHGDIKPSNILTVGGAAQVCDFGLAKMIGDMRKTSTALTLAYASPEVFDGAPPSPTSDQYSLAVSYMELRNGRLPFASEEPTWTEVCRAKLQGELDLTSLPVAEREALARGTAFAPEDRFPTCLAMVTTLRDTQRPPPPAPPSRVGRLIQLAGLVFVAALCTGLLAKFIIPSSRPTNPWQELKQDLNKGQFQLAAGLLRDFSDGERPRAQQQIKTAWHALADGLSAQGEWDEAWRQRSDFLELFPDDPVSLLGVTNDAWQRVATGTSADLDAAERWFKFVQSRAGSIDSAEHRGIDAAAQLGLLSIAARRGNWSELRRQEERLNGAISAAPPAAQFHGNLLRILLKYDPRATGRDKILPADGASDAGRFVADLTDTWPLPDFSLDALYTHIDRWEQARIDALRAQAFDELSPHFAAFNPDDQRRAQQVWVGGFESWQVKSLLRQAESQLAAADFPGCQEVLDRAAKLAGESRAFRDQIESIRTRVALRDRSRAPAKVWQQVSQWANEATGQWALETAAALVAWVDRNPAYAQRAAQALQSVAQREGMPAKGHARLQAATLHLAAVGVICSANPEPASVAALLRSLADVEPREMPDAVVNAARAECLIGVPTKPPKAAAWREADRSIRAALAATEQDGERPFGDYVAYVAALVQAKDPTHAGTRAAAEALAKALCTAPRSVACNLARRRNTAATILVQAAVELRQAGAESINKAAFSADDAQVAFGYLDKAQGLAASPSPDLLTNLALAAFYKNPADLTVATSVAEQLIARGKPTGQLLLVSALAHARRFEQEKQPADRATAIRRFSELLDRQWATAASDRQEAQKAVYQQIVMPALQLAESLPAKANAKSATGLGPSLATLFAAQGRLIEQNYNLRKQYGPAQAYAAFGKAIEFAPRADYYVARGRALIEREEIDPAAKLEELKRLAQRALDIEHSHRGAHGLMGYALVLDSRTRPQREQRRSDLQKAIAHYDAAIPPAGPLRDPDIAVYLVGRSTAYVEAAFLVNQITAKRRLLDRAAADAQQATEITARRHPEYAWNAWGNAREDIAYYCQQPDVFDDADEKFTRAIREAFSHGTPTAASLLNRGRARFRHARAGDLSPRKQAQMLDAARTDLIEALGQHESHATNNLQERAEINVWIGQVYKTTAYQAKPEGNDRQLIDHLEKANKYVAAAATLAKDHDVLNWPEYQVQSAELALVRSLVGDATAAEWRQRARQRVTQFRTAKLAYEKRPDLVLRSMITDILAVTDRGTQRQLIDRYRTEFPLTNAANRPFNVQLLLLRGELIVAAMQTSEPLADSAQAASDAQEGIRLATEMGANPWAISFRARAAGVLGVVHLANYYEQKKTVDLLQACSELRKAASASVQFDAPQPLSDVVAWHLASRHRDSQIWMAWANYMLITLPPSKLTPAQRTTVDQQREQLKTEGRQAAAARNIAELVQLYDRLESP